MGGYSKFHLPLEKFGHALPGHRPVKSHIVEDLGAQLTIPLHEISVGDRKSKSNY